MPTPQISIEETPEPAVCKDTDWWCQGFVFGVNNPNSEPGPPAPLDQPFLDAYYAGAAAGRQARANYEAGQDQGGGSPDDGPAIGPDRGGESYDKLEREYQEAWAEFLLHRHQPHTENEEYKEEELPEPLPLSIPAD